LQPHNLFLLPQHLFAQAHQQLEFLFCPALYLILTSIFIYGIVCYYNWE
jgi:hypothetical protein